MPSASCSGTRTTRGRTSVRSITSIASRTEINFVASPGSPLAMCPHCRTGEACDAIELGSRARPFQQIRVRHRDEIARLDLYRVPQAVEPLRGDRFRVCRRDHRFKLQKGPEPLDLVEVDAHV